MQTTIQSQTKLYGRLVGMQYLLIAFIGFFSIMYVPGEIISEVASETVANLKSKRNLFRWGIGFDILTFSIEIALTSMLYQVFKSVNATFATIATYARFAMIVIMGVNLLVYLIPLVLIESSTVSVAFQQNQINGLVALCFDIHAKGILLWGIFFGIHLLLLGLLVRKSAHHPSWLGLLMQIGSLGYVIEAINDFCFSNNERIAMLAMTLLIVVVVGELGFAVWLIIKGRQ